MDESFLSKLAIPGVLLLIAFLAYTSQLLFIYIEPGPPNRRQTLIFNMLLFCLLICYARSCRTDPGCVSEQWQARATAAKPVREAQDEYTKEQPKTTQRWCRKCQAPKPPRAHHCRHCRRCILKMDHHCPWTHNCVSHRVFPHFVRFLFYAVTAMTYLGYLLYPRVAIIYHNRNLPSYLGPSAFQLTHLFILLTTLSLTWTALTILFLRTAYSLCTNTTTIESWEIDRHATLLRRARYLGGYLDGPDGQRIPITKQEFPYDIGVWRNLVQGMGTVNPILWFWPLSGSPSMQSGLDFEVNGFEHPERTWPPPDPDRMPRVAATARTGERAFVHDDGGVEAFKRRQTEDLKRWNRDADVVQRRRPFVERLEAQIKQPGDVVDGNDNAMEEVKQNLGAVNTRGEESWKNSEGESLADFGLDEDAEFYDEEDIPLGMLIRKKQLQRADQSI